MNLVEPMPVPGENRGIGTISIWAFVAIGGAGIVLAAFVLLILLILWGRKGVFGETPLRTARSLPYQRTQWWRVESSLFRWCHEGTISKRWGPASRAPTSNAVQSSYAATGTRSL